jgi:mitotic spindle assembly checkpoint protein MAD1
MLQLRQMFAVKTAEFSEALLAILSIKVAFYDNGQVRDVPSTYDFDAVLVFQPVPRGADKEGNTEAFRT